VVIVRRHVCGVAGETLGGGPKPLCDRPVNAAGNGNTPMDALSPENAVVWLGRLGGARFCLHWMNWRGLGSGMELQMQVMSRLVLIGCHEVSWTTFAKLENGERS
jgi:hypothetical protein